MIQDKNGPSLPPPDGKSPSGSTPLPGPQDSKTQQQVPSASLAAAMATRRPLLISVKDEEAPASTVAALLAAGYDLRYSTAFPDMDAAFKAGGVGGKPIAVVAASGSEKQIPNDAMVVRVLPDKGEQLPRTRDEEKEEEVKDSRLQQDRHAHALAQSGKGQSLLRPYTRGSSSAPVPPEVPRGLPNSSGGVTVHP